MTIRNITHVEDLLRTAPKPNELHWIWQETRKNAPADQKGKQSSATASGNIPWLQDRSLAQKFVQHALKAEEHLLVLDAAREILRGWDSADDDDRTKLLCVRMDYARALTRLGFTREARLELEPCVRDDFRPELGCKLKTDLLLELGDILLEEWHDAGARAAQVKSAEDALHFYQRARDTDPDRLEALVQWSFTNFILSDGDEPLSGQTQSAAREILQRTKELGNAEGPRRRTTLAAATAHALLGEFEQAFESFQRLQSMSSTAELAEARFQAQILACALGKTQDYFKKAFPPLQLIVFAGHLPDLPGGPPRLPLASIPDVRNALRAKLNDMGARVGLVSASAGADLLFTEVMREMKGTFHLVLPWSRDEFRRSSVEPYEPPGNPIWEPLFQQALEAAATTREIGQVYEPSSDVGWEFMLEVTAGIALRTARALRLDVQPMVLWDGRRGWGTGGTDSFHTLWSRKLGIEPIVVSPPAIDVPAVLNVGASRRRGCERPLLHQEVKSMLFADIVGYSKLTEKAIPDFIGVFLERLGQLAASSKHAPCKVNTWGDALYAVFDFAQDAGLFALELVQMIQDGHDEWLQKGLYWESLSEQRELIKHPLNVRIGLHTGPVVMHFDPVVRSLGFTGAHVNRAARIEPVAKPGQVFASEEFAAMVELSSEIRKRDASHADSDLDSKVVCEYAGSMQLAKGYPGLHRIYRVVLKRVFVLERLAMAAHDAFRAESRARGDKPETHSSMRPWDELSEDLREANRAQVADITNKLRLLGYELTPNLGMVPSEIMISDPKMEEMATLEHDRWAAERRLHGWTYAAKRDNARKFHPMLVPWESLSESEKEKDRDTIRNLPNLVAQAGFRVRPVR